MRVLIVWRGIPPRGTWNLLWRSRILSKKYLYLFSEGNKDMREILGGKGANLAEMTNAGMPVPQGFTISTEACTQYYKDCLLYTSRCV